MDDEPTNPIIVTTEALAAGEVVEYDTFDDAYTALMASLEPGGSIDLYGEDCALVVDGPECTCTPHRITKGAVA